MLTAREALARLQEGNRRFAAGVRGIDALTTQARRAELAARLEPFAIVLDLGANAQHASD